jgi:hypothetical protein
MEAMCSRWRFLSGLMELFRLASFSLDRQVFVFCSGGSEEKVDGNTCHQNDHGQRVRSQDERRLQTRMRFFNGRIVASDGSVYIDPSTT